MRLYVFFLSFVLAFFPSLSHAFTPIAIAGSTAGRIAIQNGTGAVIKKVAPESFKKATHSALGVCAKNPSAFAFCGALLSSIGKDGWKIEVENTTNNNDIDINIYKNDIDDCIKFCSTTVIDGTCYDSPQEYFVSSPFSKNTYNHILKRIHPTSFNDVTNSLSSKKVTFYGDWSYNLNGDTQHVKDGAIKIGFAVYKDSCTIDKKYISDGEIDDYIRKNISDDDVTNIYNYDYSQHNKIEINNNTDEGDTINNKLKNDIDKNETEKNVSANATEKMKNKRKGYDVDDINDENCEKNDKGEYDKCGDDRGKKDGEDEEEPKKEDEEKKDDEKKEDDEDDIISCQTSDFHKKICKFIDDMDEFLDESDDKNTQLKKSDDDPNPTSTKISFGGGCPPNTVINVDFLGISKNIVLFDSVRFCEFLDDFVKPSVVVISSLWAVYILRGSNNV